ncbi:MAG: GHKL domain-containing protein [Bdellovibrionales bacterium]|nr:GHKL domain-containing protein [Bdellovibrionales bacterium]
MSFESTEKQNLIMDNYLLFSMLSSIGLWAGHFWQGENLLLDGPFITMLAVGNLMYYIYASEKEILFYNTSTYPALFIFQIITIIGAAFTQKLSSLVYLAVIPTIAGSLFFYSRATNFNFKERHKGVGLLFIGILSYLLLGRNNLTLLSRHELIALTTFLLWGPGTLFFSLFVNTKKMNHSEIEQDSQILEKDRFFFHDLINHTHCMNLLLSYKTDHGDGLNHKESVGLLNELKMLEDLLQSHFKLPHVNLKDSVDYLPFDQVRQSIEKIIYSFLAKDKVNVIIHYQGSIGPTVPVAKRMECCVLHLPLYRIITNIAKNVSEVKSREVIFNFDYRDDGLYLEIKNKTPGLDNTIKNSVESITQKILDSSEQNKIYRGIGLESVSMLCDNMNGSFDFIIENNYWKSSIYLPNPINQAMLLDKKVA